MRADAATAVSMCAAVVLALGGVQPAHAQSVKHSVPDGPRTSIDAQPAPTPGVDCFASAVHDYSPAPGQFVNDSRFNDPARALGPPVGGGTLAPDNSKLVTLGGFGGSITLGFNRTVWNTPGELDAIVFSNAFYAGGNPNRRWAECAVIEISRDVNGNGLPDDPWYLVPGSHITDPQGQWTVVTWDDDTNDPTNPPPHPSWIPPGKSGTWTTETWLLPGDVFNGPIVTNPHGTDAQTQGIYGHPGYSPTLILGDLTGNNSIDDPDITPEMFYTVADDPFATAIAPGSGGGDAFDISWAIDPATGQPANLDGFDFIRITTAVHSIHPVFGEISIEVGGVARAMPPELRRHRRPPESDPAHALIDFLRDWSAGAAAADLNMDGVVDETDLLRFLLDFAGQEK